MAQTRPSHAQPDSLLRWRVHLARRDPRRAVVAIIIIAASAAAVYSVWHHPVAAVAAGLLLLSSVAEFLMPIHYCVSSEGVSCRNFWSARYLKWADVRRSYRDARGIKLSPLSRPSRLEAYRGIYLWLGDDAEAALAAIRRYLQEARSS